MPGTIREIQKPGLPHCSRRFVFYTTRRSRVQADVYGVDPESELATETVGGVPGGFRCDRLRARVRNDAATDGAVGAGAAGLCCPRDLEALGLGVDRSQIEAQGGQTCASNECTFDESSAGEFHNSQPPW